MSKKVLALLVAASAFCAFACDSDDDNATTCTNGAKQCSGNKVQVCVKNAWKDTTTCPNACVKGVCVSDGTDPDTDTDKDKDQTGACTATSTAECTSACNADKTAGYYWSAKDNSVKAYECYTGKSCVVDSASGKVSCVADSSGGDTETEDCKEGGTVYCNKNCSSDRSKGYYYSKGAVQVVTCANNDCTINSKNYVVCESEDGSSGGETTTCTGSEVTTGGTVGQCCNRDTYQQTCINSGANALVCWDGAVTQWTCANNECSANESKPLQVVCSKDSSSGGETCDSATDTTKTCTDANTVKYCYKGKWYTKTCTTCMTNADNTYYCCNGENDKCTGSSTTETCTTEDEGKGTCAEGGATARVCKSGVMKDWTCYNNICNTKEDGTIYCPKDEAAATPCTGENVTSGGAEGQCCDKATYVPSGCDTALRCSSAGKLVKWTCKDNQTCSYDAATKYFTCV